MFLLRRTWRAHQDVGDGRLGERREASLSCLTGLPSLGSLTGLTAQEAAQKLVSFVDGKVCRPACSKTVASFVLRVFHDVAG